MHFIVTFIHCYSANMESQQPVYPMRDVWISEDKDQTTGYKDAYNTSPYIAKIRKANH